MLPTFCGFLIIMKLIVYYYFFRDIENDKEHIETQATTTWQRAVRTMDTQFLMAACVLVVLAAIVIYMKHLKWCPRTEDLKRVPSMSLFMTEQDQMEQGVEVVKGQTFNI